jgi:hypothetical protein
MEMASSIYCGDAAVADETLNLADAAQDMFSFLMTELPFSVVSVANRAIRWESPEVFVELGLTFHGVLEVNVAIGLRDDVWNGQQRRFDLSEILELAGVDLLTVYGRCEHTQKSVHQSVASVANAARLHAIDYLKGSRSAFGDLSRFRAKKSANYSQRTALTRMRAEASHAWEERAYAKVVAIFTPFEKILTPAESAKLTYAKKHCR